MRGKQPRREKIRKDLINAEKLGFTIWELARIHETQISKIKDEIAFLKTKGIIVNIK